jgi:hypothetical protein
LNETKPGACRYLFRPQDANGNTAMHIFLDRAGEGKKKNRLGFLTAVAAFNG